MSRHRKSLFHMDALSCYLATAVFKDSSANRSQQMAHWLDAAKLPDGHAGNSSIALALPLVAAIARTGSFRALMRTYLSQGCFRQALFCFKARLHYLPWLFSNIRLRTRLRNNRVAMLGYLRWFNEELALHPHPRFEAEEPDAADMGWGWVLWRLDMAGWLPHLFVQGGLERVEEFYQAFQQRFQSHPYWGRWMTATRTERGNRYLQRCLKRSHSLRQMYYC
ncbi:MAG: hypothetical protein ACR2PW_05770 [Gammaproteobacteria bacterium]